MQLTGNTILITGGGSGIGRGLAKALHRMGNQVIITGRRQSALAQVTSANPGMQVMSLDVSDADNIRRIAEVATIAFPSLNVLIHNAGIQRPEDVRSGHDHADDMVATNLLGLIRLTVPCRPCWSVSRARR